MVPHLHLISLGAPLLLTEAGDQIRFRTRKHFALLIRLAVEAGRKFTRDYLMDLLWPDVPAARARHSLAQALTVLKAKVGREHLMIQRASVGLAPGAVQADVGTLDAGVPAIRGPFLDGFEVPGAVQFEQWKDEWRAKLMPRIRDSLVKQMDAGRRIGDFAAVEKHARLLLELDPLSEDAVRGVMEARAWVGDRSNALKVYARFEARLAEELGAKPSADLVRMANLLREGRRAAPRPDGAAAGQVSERQERRFEAETLIGRETEFSCLYDAWLQVRRREPRIVVVLGDPGVGKTTLVNAFVSTCQMEGAAIARAQAYEAERELPFAVLAELIKQLTVQRAIGGADPEALSELTRVSPEIFAAFPGVPKPVEWAAEVIPLRLADSFLKAVEAATEESPLVLVVDDIHAADNATVAILHIVARKLPSTRLLLILTARSTELHATAAARALVYDGAIRALEALALDVLSDEAGQRLVGARVSMADGKIGDVPITRILQASSGNPLALELLTKEWLAHGPSSLLRDLEALNTQPVANIGIPRAIGAVFERQVRRLDAPTRAALDLAAVLGRRLTTLPLYRVVHLSEAAAGEALSRLSDEGFFRQVHGGLEFRNELIRAQVYYGIAGPGRMYLHQGVAEVLEVERDGRSAKLEVAWHFLRGGDAIRAATNATEGAEAAISAGALSEAEQILTALVRQALSDGIAQRLKLLLATAMVGQSKAAAAKPILESLARDEAMSDHERARAARLEATVEYLSNQEPGVAYCYAADRALRTAQKTGDLELVGNALFECARSGANAGSEERVATVREETENVIAATLVEPPPILLYAKAYCDYFFFDLAMAASGLERAIRVLNERDDPAGLSLAYTAYGTCQLGLCQFDLGCDAYDNALKYSTKIGDDFKSAIIVSNMCVAKLHQGDFVSAVRFGELATSMAARALSPRSVVFYLNLAAALIMNGQRDAAIAAINSAQQASMREQSWIATMEFLMGYASFALETRDIALALQLTEKAERVAWGKERAVPSSGLFDKLRVHRVVRLSGPDAARPLVSEARERYVGRHPFYYLDAVACGAWLDKLSTGKYSDESESGLALFDTLGARGLRGILVAQGFLE